MKTPKTKSRRSLQRMVGLTELLTRVSLKLRLPFVLHRGGKGKPGRGSAWSVESRYPVSGKPYPGIVHAAAPTLAEALSKFRDELSQPNDKLTYDCPTQTKRIT